jgi:hypothetical protein
MTTLSRSWDLRLGCHGKRTAANDAFTRQRLSLVARCQVAGHENPSIESLCAAGATCPKNETSTGPGSWQSLEISSSKMVRAEAPRCCAVLPIARGRDTAVATCWLRKGSTAVVIGHEILPRYRRFLHGQSRQGFAEGMFVSRRGRNRRCAKAGSSRLNRGVFVRKGAGDASTHDRMGFGTEAVLQLERIAIFLYSFWSGLMATDRGSPRGMAISARKLAQMRADF